MIISELKSIVGLIRRTENFKKMTSQLDHLDLFLRSKDGLIKDDPFDLIDGVTFVISILISTNKRNLNSREYNNPSFANLEFHV